jgi:porin
MIVIRIYSSPRLSSEEKRPVNLDDLGACALDLQLAASPPYGAVGHLAPTGGDLRPVGCWSAANAALLAIAAAACTASAARAQVVDATEAALVSPEQSLFERATLTGDWHGRRSALEERGIEIGLSVYQDALFVRGGVEDSNDFPGLIEPALSLDMGRLAGWDNTQIFVRGIGTYGRDPGEATGSLNVPSNLANSVATFALFESWIERAFLDESLSVRVGLYAADTEFDVKETAGIFMNGGFGTGIDLSQSGLNGPCVFPASCFGVRIKYQPTPAHYAMVAVLDGGAGDPKDPRGTHVHLGGDDGALALGEVGYQRGADEGRFLRAALGAWHYTTTFDDLIATDAEGEPLRRDGTGGLYALVEGELYREQGQISQGLSGFLRVGVADQAVNPVRHYVGAGLAYTGLFTGCDEDVIGLGVSVPINSDRFMRAQELAGTPVDRQELAFELAYLKQVTPWLAMQFDAQYIVNPGTDPALDDARAVGMRLNFTF